MPTISLMKEWGIPAPDFEFVQRRGISGRLLNGYRDLDPMNSLVKRKGYSLFKDFGSPGTPIQGIYESQITGNVYCLYNGLLRKIDFFGNPTTITGTSLNTSAPYASFTHDGTYLYVANGGRINGVNESIANANVLTGGTTPDLVTHVNFLRGFILSNGLQSGGVAGDTNFSDDHGSTWELYNNEFHPDASSALWIRADEVAAFGPYSMESSYLDGVTPWGVIQGAQLAWGLRAPYSVVLHQGAFMFMSVFNNAVRFVRLDIREPVDFSQKYMRTIGNLTDHANAKAWGITRDGVPYYVVTFPADDRTLVYNIALNEWYEWGTWDGAVDRKWRINCAAYIRGWNRTLIGDPTDAKIYWLDNSLTDNGTLISFNNTSAFIDHGSSISKRQSRLDFKLKRGQSIDASEPTFDVIISDNGKTFKAPRTVSLGLNGDTDFYSGFLLMGGRYRSKSYQIVHRDTKSDFVMPDIEETFEWGVN